MEKFEYPINTTDRCVLIIRRVLRDKNMHVDDYRKLTDSLKSKFKLKKQLHSICYEIGIYCIGDVELTKNGIKCYGFNAGHGLEENFIARYAKEYAAKEMKKKSIKSLPSINYQLTRTLKETQGVINAKVRLKRKNQSYRAAKRRGDDVRTIHAYGSGY